jgi:Protein of unknown function (DUF2971)
MVFLYKYYSNLDYVLDVILNKRLYFSPPNNFNDPFDCHPKFSLVRCKNDDIADWREFFSILAKEEYPGISHSESIEHAKAALKKGLHHNKEWLLDSDHYDTQVHNEELKKVRISCFTKTPRNQMMWAHYANNHKGIVLQFRASYMSDADTGDFKGFDVEYYSNHINLKRYVDTIKETLKGDDLAFSRLMYCTKSIEWAQEEEVRFFSNNTYVSFPEEMLTGILLGSQSPSLWKKLFNKVLLNWTSKPKLFQEDVKKSSIKMCFTKLN